MPSSSSPTCNWRTSSDRGIPVAVSEPESGDEPVPKLPRGRGFKLSGQTLIRIAGTLALLVMLLIMQKPCAKAVSKFVTGFGDSSAGSAMPRPGTVDQPSTAPVADDHAQDQYEHIGGNMTDAEIKAAIERAKAKAHAGSGSAAASGSGSGS